VLRAAARVITMRMRDDGPPHRAPRIDKKISRLAVEAIGCRSNEGRFGHSFFVVSWNVLNGNGVFCPMDPEISNAILRLAWIPFVTAFIGWVTNWMAIQMLFRPRQPWHILGMKIQGLIPRRQEEIAERIAEVVEQEFLSQHLIREQLAQLDVHSYVDGFVKHIVRDRVAVKLRSIPLIGGMINDNTLASLERMALESIHAEIEPLRNKIATDIEARLQVRDIVRDRILAFEMDKLEELVRRVASREFRLIELLGGALGFVVGLAQVGILLLIS